MSDQLKERMERMRVAKSAIAALTSVAPRFLYSPSDARPGQLAVDRYSQVWYIDAVTGLMLYPFPGQPWRGFSGDAVQRTIVADLALYVHNGQLLDLALMDERCAEAYGMHWPAVRAQLEALPAFAAMELA